MTAAEVERQPDADEAFAAVLPFECRRSCGAGVGTKCSEMRSTFDPADPIANSTNADDGIGGDAATGGCTTTAPGDGCHAAVTPPWWYTADA